MGNRERSYLAGLSDFTGVDLEGLIEHLRDWRANTEDTIRLLQLALAEVEKHEEDFSAHVFREVLGFAHHMIDTFTRYIEDFDRLIKELPDEVAERHIAIIDQLYQDSKAQERLCVSFKRDAYEGVHAHCEMIPLTTRVYAISRDMMIDYSDLSNINHRLKTYLGHRRATAKGLDALELKPNIFGVGLNLNYVLQRLHEWWRRKRAI